MRLKRYTVENGKIPQNFDGFTMFVISDLHDSPFAEQIAELVKATSPDVIFFTGDLIFGDKTKNLGAAGKLTEKLGGRYPVYGIGGNHEGNMYMIAGEQFHNRGGIWLDDSRETLTRGGESIAIIGLRDRTFDGKAEENMLSAMQQLTPTGLYTVTLCHDPMRYAILKDCETDLIFAGHEHGGLIRLPKIGGLFGHNGQRFFPRYCYGRYKEGAAEMIVSGGCDDGRHYPRFNNPPEVLAVTLRRR